VFVKIRHYGILSNRNSIYNTSIAQNISTINKYNNNVSSKATEEANESSGEKIVELSGQCSKSI
jgi:hypothetical protein